MTLYIQHIFAFLTLNSVTKRDALYMLFIPFGDITKSKVMVNFIYQGSRIISFKILNPLNYTLYYDGFKNVSVAWLGKSILSKHIILK